MSKYPVDRSTCEGCTMCALVTETITGRHIPEEEQYYQCLSDMDDVCGDTDTPDIDLDYIDEDDMEDMHPEDREVYADRFHNGALGVDEYIGY